MIEGRDSIIKIGRGPSGIEYDQKAHAYTFYVQTYFEDFRRAVDSYINGLDAGTESNKKLEDALKAKPELL
jgi:hypothetical protein